MSSMSWPTAMRWIMLTVLAIVAWRGISSESQVVSSIALFIFVSIILSSANFGRIHPPVPYQGDIKIVLQEANIDSGDQVARILVDHFSIEQAAASKMLEYLPITLEPAVILRSQAEDLVAKLNRAGAVASLVTTDEESP